MATYYINEAAFDVPDIGFSDQTVHLLRAKASRTGDIHVMTFRSKVEGDAGLREVVASHRDNERRTLAGFASLLDREVEIAGSVAIESAIRYRSDGGMVYQRNAHILLGDQHLLIAVNGPFEERETCDRTMDHVLGTLRLRTD